MIFSSFGFLHFFLAVFGVFLAVRRRPALWKPWLLAASYLFYMTWNPPFVLLLIGTSALDYWIGRRLGIEERPGARKAWMALSLASNLGVLGLFKYYGFVRENLGLIDWSLPPWRFILPLGISFYTFMSLGYTVDCYRRTVKPCGSLLDFLLFVSFFPHLVAGPILRAREFLPQLARAPRVRWKAFYLGLGMCLLGLAKKTLIADRLAPFVEEVYGSPGGAGALGAWLGTYAFAAQIYCDFSGYSDMAIGLARMMGLRLPRNFRSPYLASSPREFWRRWHITLSTWLRDYLYVSLGGSRGGRWRTSMNLAVTMLLGGLWHGASWTFLAWGAFHGLWLVLHRAWEGLHLRIPRAVAILASFHLVCLGWVWFRAGSAADALLLWGRMLGAGGGTAWAPLPLLALLAAAAAIHLGALDRLAGPRLLARRPLLAVASMSVLVWLLMLYAAPAREFIYFAF